jgi:hypothetical protein
MPGIARELLLSALAAKQNHLQVILGLPNVIACGIGYKVTSNGLTGDLAVVVSVTRKIPEVLLSAVDLIPRVIDGIKTDVIETGIFRAFQGTRDRWRPVIPPGVSLGHVNATAGTFGCLVRRGNDLFILSNNHVLANANQGRVGDLIIQPGRLDGGGPQDRIATLADYIPLDFGSDAPTCNLAMGAEKTLNLLSGLFGSQHRLMAYQQTQGLNRLDAALARPDDPAWVTPDIVGIGRPLGTRRATLGTRVKKSGRSTGTTEGRIIQIDVTSQVSYGPAQARFYGQLMATGMSQPGDSGSAVLDKENYVVGLLFAGSDNATLITPIQPVLEALRVELVASA